MFGWVEIKSQDNLIITYNSNNENSNGMNEVYHNGERLLQKKYGEEVFANNAMTVIANSIIKGAIIFVEKQPMAIVSSVDSRDNVWISMLAGNFGFTEVPNQNKLSFNKEKILSPQTDIFFKNIEENSSIGSLFIELGSRRRFRINGKATVTSTHINIDIREAYPNCPKYIQKRTISFPDRTHVVNETFSHGFGLNQEQKKWIIKADTFFVGSKSASGKLDASHRGGNAGFIEVLEDGTLKIPDYVGNSMYNTLGNIVEDPNVGLLFIDFEKGNTLQLSGKATLLLDEHSAVDNQKTTNTGRYWLFKTEKWIQIDGHHKFKWEYVDASRFNPEF